MTTKKKPTKKREPREEFQPGCVPDHPAGDGREEEACRHAASETVVPAPIHLKNGLLSGA
jgi:hypothetical protein